jgi:hypothetical protein
MHAFRFALLAVALATAASAQAQVITVGPNVNVTRLTGSQEETGIAINRVNPNQIAISSNSQSGLVTRYTTDGGSTWAASSLVTAGGYDSWMGADQFGNIFLSYQESQVTKITRSTDGGANYTLLQTIAGGGADHPEMGVGPGNVAGTNNIYLRDSVGSGSRIIFGSSSGLGVTSSFTTLTGQGSGNFGSSAVGPGGRSVFTVMGTGSGSVGPATLPIRYDADGTGPGGYTLQSTISTNVGGFRPVPAQPSRTVDTQVQLQYDFSGGVYNGNLYMVYTQAANTSTSDTNIVFRRSSDNGLTFSNEVTLNDDGGTSSQFFSRLAVDPTTGYLASVWYDARNSPANNTVELWGSASFDSGLTWTPNFKVSEGISNGRATNTGDGNEFGDYISMDFYNGTMVTAWADSSNSTGDNPNGTRGLDVYFASISISAVPEPASWALMSIGLLVGAVRARRRA